MGNQPIKDIDKSRKSVWYRIVVAAAVILLIALPAYFCYVIAINNADGSHWINFICLVVLMLFMAFESAILLKNIHHRLVIHDIAFNENKTYNRTGLVIVNVAMLIGIGLLVYSTIIFCLNGPDTEYYIAGATIIPVSAFLVLNALSFDVFSVLFKDRFKIEDLLK